MVAVIRRKSKKLFRRACRFGRFIHGSFFGAIVRVVPPGVLFLLGQGVVVKETTHLEVTTMKKSHTEFALSMNLDFRVRTPGHKLGVLISVLCTVISVALWLLP